MEQQEPTICPWCQTEIVWDEEIGPEKHCPHCENELSGYRTLQFGLENDDDAEEDEEDGDWESGEAGEEADAQLDLSEFRNYDRDRLVLEETMERILDEQLEAPECPSCREYMLEAGIQTVAESHFKPRTPAALKAPLLAPPFQTVLYVCPSCFQTVNRLAPQEQERLVQLLAEAAED